MSRTGIYDIHCHIVPGVDDGASDYEDTKKLLRMEYDQGVRNIIATPHFRFRMFETPLSRVQEQFLLVQKAAAVILISYLSNDTIKTQEDVERYLKLSTLGTIPMSEEDRKNKKKKKQKKQKRGRGRR